MGSLPYQKGRNHCRPRVEMSRAVVRYRSNVAREASSADSAVPQKCQHLFKGASENAPRVSGPHSSSRDPQTACRAADEAWPISQTGLGCSWQSTLGVRRGTLFASSVARQTASISGRGGRWRCARPGGNRVSVCSQHQMFGGGKGKIGTHQSVDGCCADAVDKLDRQLNDKYEDQ